MCLMLKLTMGTEVRTPTTNVSECVILKSHVMSPCHSVCYHELYPFSLSESSYYLDCGQKIWIVKVHMEFCTYAAVGGLARDGTINVMHLLLRYH